MIARLDDPYFEAEFLTETTARGHRKIDTLAGADGIFFWCPCGYAKRPEVTHGVIVSFSNPIGAPVAPPDAGSRSRGGGPSRWTMSGTGLADLTLSPSVDVGTPSCWHGWIKNGEIT
ncbi:MAG TPA: DUF6527 family protein [bacterium]|nr:DUF6527 family protein [bacterium]